MRTQVIEKNLYKFDELDEATQDEAIEKLANINVDYEWWDCTYEDAKNIGLKITEFDIDRGDRIKGKLTMSLKDSLAAILKNHGDVCETYKTALGYKQTLDDLLAKDALLPEDEQNSFELDEQIDELEEEFRKEILEDYLSILRQEFEYQTSREAIVETIECNDYEFDEDGNLS